MAKPSSSCIKTLKLIILTTTTTLMLGLARVYKVGLVVKLAKFFLCSLFLLFVGLDRPQNTKGIEMQMTNSPVETLLCEQSGDMKRLCSQGIVAFWLTIKNNVYSHGFFIVKQFSFIRSL